MTSSAAGQNRRESIISICLLAILVLIALGIGLKHHTTISWTNKTPATEPKPQVTFTPAGFEALSATENYGSDNLYEKINGKAPLYLEAGFKKLLTQRFVNKADDSLWMELFTYDMGNFKNAFSVFSRQRRPNADIISLFHPTFGYRTENALFFVQANNYIEIVGSSNSKELFDAILETAKNIRAEKDATVIPEIALFPRENLDPGSIKLYFANTFGFENLTDTFTANYLINGQTLTAFLSKRTNPQDAQKIAKSYYNFLLNNGGTAIPAIDKTAEIKAVDFYGTVEIIFSDGPFVAGIHEAQDQKNAEKLAKNVKKQLKKAKKR